MLAGANGSGICLSMRSCVRGVASLHYDKRASGPHVAENLPRLADKPSMASHLNELAASIVARHLRR